MNQSLLKSFAPDARKRFRSAMEQRASLLGLSADKDPVPAQKSGDRIYIGGKSFPAQWEEQRKKLAARIAKQGWNAVIDEAAYTWFNRFAAIRYMEVHGYTPQGIRVLTPTPQGSQPEILERAASVDLPGLKKEEILELKLDGQRDEELYRLLILSVCESFHAQLPLLFPAIQEDLELLLPDMLLRSDSLLSWFVKDLPDEEWQEIEILGWLYQYYISELKAEYMARKSAYKKEEIPAVTQLFTPKWIVQYLVHNSLGRSWLLHHPESDLKAKMPYYIEPAPQEPEVEAELKHLFNGSLNPEDIKLLDPAMGSGHILVTAYELLREIYLERGYQRQQCARLILEKNLYGLDIDLRATEIACFALLMKAREDDPTILSNGKDLRLNLQSFKDCSAEERADLIQSLNPTKNQRENLQAVLSLFEQGTLFGSLIQIPEHLVGDLGDLELWLENVASGHDLLASKAAEVALVFVRLAQVLGQKYDQVVSNPPYMGTKGMSPALKSYVEGKYKNGKSDLFASFMLRGFDWLRPTGFNAMVTMQSWMFLSSYEEMRVDLLDNRTLVTMAHLGARAFGQISGEVVQTTASIFLKKELPEYMPTFFRLLNGDENDKNAALLQYNFKYENTKQRDFRSIPGRPIAYWISAKVRNCFLTNDSLDSVADTRKGMVTGDNDRFTKFWFEIVFEKIGFGYKSRNEAALSTKKWFPYVKGGGFRKWYGNVIDVLLWENDGEQMRNARHPTADRPLASNFNLEYIFKPNLSWGTVASTEFSVRKSYGMELFDQASNACFPSDNCIDIVLSFMNSSISKYCLKAINPTLNFVPGDIGRLPIVNTQMQNEINEYTAIFLAISKSDWDAFETSWDFQSLPWLSQTLLTYLKDTTMSAPDPHSIASCWNTWRAIGYHWTADMLRLEEENNRLFIDAYGLQDELTPEVPIEQITLTVNPWYRYKPRKSKAEATEEDGPGFEAESPEAGESQPRTWNEEPGAAGTAAGPLIYPEGEERMRADGARELVSYALGCMLGRYSLDEPGLVYAEAGGLGFDAGRYLSFAADDDGIVPVTDFKWFDEDAAARVEAFVRTVWGAVQHEENMAWLAEGLE